MENTHTLFLIFGENTKLPCRGLCERHGIKAYTNRYEENVKRCMTCDAFVKAEGFFCPCCNGRLRTRTRHAEFKERIKIFARY